MGLISGNLLKGLLVRQQALPTHVPKIPLYLLSFELRPFHLEPGVPRGHLQQFFGLLVGSFGDRLYDCAQQLGSPALVAFPGVALWKTGDGDALEQLLRVDFSLGHFICALHCTPDNDVGVDRRKALVVFHLDEALEELVILFVALGVAEYCFGVVGA
jgi:hypothetical protein